MMNEGTIVPNTEACRARMMECMQADEQGKARQEAHDRKKKEKQHEAAEGEGQDDGQVQAPAVEHDVGAREAAGDPQLEVAGGETPDILEDPAQAAQPTSSSSKAKAKPLPAQGSKRPGIMKISSGPPLSEVKPAPPQGEKRSAEEPVEVLRGSTDTREERPSPTPGTTERAAEEATFLTKHKKVFKTLIRRQVLDTYELHGLDISQEDADSIAELSCQMCAVDGMEIYSPKRFTDMAEAFKLRPGFAIDLTEQKPEGTYWDLNKSEDVREVNDRIDQEEPKLLTGSPPCHIFSQLQNISWHKIRPEVREKRMSEALRHLHVSCQMYRKQYNSGRVGGFFTKLLVEQQVGRTQRSGHFGPYLASGWSKDQGVAGK